MKTITKLTEIPSLHAKAKRLLDEVWDEVLAIADLESARDVQWSDVIHSLITEGGSTYPYMLLTQVLGKATDETLNATCIQESSEKYGAWDARSLASRVVVPWNVSVDRPFQGANSDPYVNNPARYKNFGKEMRAKAGNKSNYNSLEAMVIAAEEGGGQESKHLLRLILIEARRSLEANKRDYFGPKRVGAVDILDTLMKFLSERSSGVRLQIVCYALYQALAEIQPSLGTVSSAKTNAADLSSNRTGDVECHFGDQVVLAVEVKDRVIRLDDVSATVLKARKNSVDNVLFIGSTEPLLENKEDIVQAVEAEFAHGIEVNFTHIKPHAFQILLQLSPEKRAAFLRKTHDALHEKGAQFANINRWMDLLKSI